MRHRKIWWFVLAVSVAAIVGIAAGCRQSSGVAFLYDLDPREVNITDVAVSPSRHNEVSSFTYAPARRTDVIAALRRFAARRHWRFFEADYVPYVGSISGDPTRIYNINWAPLDRDLDGSSGRRGDFIVVVYRNESAIEVKFHQLMRFFQL